jgi:HNH endonuclease
VMKNQIEKFWLKTRAIGRYCIEWIGGRDARGYGQFYYKKAHRFAWEITYGPIPEGMHVLHRCDNTWCVNPDHLFLGTHADNHADKVRKGRQARGETHGCAKLTEDQVREIRAMASDGLSKRGTAQRIAEMFGITRIHVYYICSRRSWRHVI